MRGDTVEVVIRIPKREIEEIKRYCRRVELKISSLEDYIYRSIANGTVLPKGHGRLIDADKVKENHERWIGYLDEDMITRLNIAVDKHIPTVIEADKEGE